jgi:formylglycine-generating enzyme required for sulfatase activity
MSRISGGEDIMVIGHPRGAGDWAILKGNIASRQGRYLTVDANIDEGNSGGPIIHSGQIVGLIGGAQRYGKGVTIGTVREYLEGHGVLQGEGAPPSVAKTAPARPPTPKAANEITGKDGAPMVWIPAGSFKMGSTRDEVDRAIQTCVQEYKNDQQTCEGWYKPELPQHTVQMDAYYLDRYEVTNRLFQQFVQQTSHRTTAEQEGSAFAFVEGKGWEDVKGASWRQPEAGATVFDSGRAEHPVVAVSWADAQAYCRWAGKRLPTEAEFEYALRAGTTTTYWWGQGNPGSRRVANIADESAKPLLRVIMSGYDDGAVRTASVGSYEANPFGLHDMTGNVSEWTADWYDETYYGKSLARNPKGPSSGQYRVLRGGSWSDAPDLVRSALRNRLTPTKRDATIGFRCAQDVPK